MHTPCTYFFQARSGTIFFHHIFGLQAVHVSGPEKIQLPEYDEKVCEDLGATGEVHYSRHPHVGHEKNFG